MEVQKYTMAKGGEMEMDDLIAVLQRIAENLSGIRIALSFIGMYLAFMLFFKDMGNGAKDAIRSLKDKISRR